LFAVVPLSLGMPCPETWAKRRLMHRSDHLALAHQTSPITRLGDEQSI
jgi:hypothetical protein